MKELRETIHNANLDKNSKNDCKIYSGQLGRRPVFMTSTEIALKLGVK